MKSKIIKLGEKDTPVRIWVGIDGFYIEYLEIENYSNLSEEDSIYLAKTTPQNWSPNTPIFFAYLKDVVSHALMDIKNQTSNRKVNIDLSDVNKNEKIVLLDMHNDPEFALKELEKDEPRQYMTPQSSIDEFLEKINKGQLKRWEKVKDKIKILPDIFK